MSTRIDACFADSASKKLIAYLTLGDPSVDETADLIVAAAESGADIVELGVPFSDPSADGPVIEGAMLRALSTGGAAPGVVAHALKTVRLVRARSQVPLVLFGYFNPFLQYGLERLAQDAASAGADGFLVVDLPSEEAAPFDAFLRARGLDRIALLAPTTSPERARLVVHNARGFAYYVAVTGTSGAAHLDVAEAEARVASLRAAVGTLPIAVGFGVRDAASVKRIAAFADAVVVGTALVERIASAKTPASRIAAVRAFIAELKG